MCMYGAGGHGKVFFEIALDLGLPVHVFVDDNPDLRMFGSLSVVAKIPDNLTSGILGIGNNKTRRKLAVQY
jgi:hypothetical protein